MQERERLIEILSRKVHPREGIDPAVVVADYLLDNDIVPVVRCRECKHCRNLPNGLCYLYTEPYDNGRGYKGEAVCVEPAAGLMWPQSQYKIGKKMAHF